jgi:hypothetical protein
VTETKNKNFYKRFGSLKKSSYLCKTKLKKEI